MVEPLSLSLSYSLCSLSKPATSRARQATHARAGGKKGRGGLAKKKGRALAQALFEKKSTPQGRPAHLSLKRHARAKTLRTPENKARRRWESCVGRQNSRRRRLDAAPRCRQRPKGRKIVAETKNKEQG